MVDNMLKLFMMVMFVIIVSGYLSNTITDDINPMTKKGKEKTERR